MARMRLGRLIAVAIETDVSLRDCSRQGSGMLSDGRCCSNFTSALITQGRRGTVDGFLFSCGRKGCVQQMICFLC